jgi:hypothetical protein
VELCYNRELVLGVDRFVGPVEAVPIHLLRRESTSRLITKSTLSGTTHAFTSWNAWKDAWVGPVCLHQGVSFPQIELWTASS